MRIGIIFFAAIILGFTACSPVQTVTLVRHGEKAADGLSLSEAGKKRATTLKNILSAQRVDSIYSTNTARTIGTAQPTADIKKLPVTIYKDNLEVIKILAHI
jgi:broad specificity phosphatase PhoE